MRVQKITPCLWFDTQAEEAARYYVSVFNNASITSVSRFGEGGPGPEGQAVGPLRRLVADSPESSQPAR
jgi:predicted 3-demethylubiquinone-9 3-methyltransferase (glyoxalase superfamily)